MTDPRIRKRAVGPRPVPAPEPVPPCVYMAFYYETAEGDSSMDHIVLHNMEDLRDQAGLAAVIKYIMDQRPGLYAKVVPINWKTLDR